MKSVRIRNYAGALFFHIWTGYGEIRKRCFDFKQKKERKGIKASQLAIRKFYEKICQQIQTNPLYMEKIQRTTLTHQNFDKRKIEEYFWLIKICKACILTLFRMGLFSVASGWGNQNLPCISYSDEIWHTYTLPKKDQKIYKTRDISLEFC